jgi:hypothetical protein
VAGLMAAPRIVHHEGATKGVVGAG